MLSLYLKKEGKKSSPGGVSVKEPVGMTEGYGAVQELVVLSSRDRDVIFQPGSNEST